MSRNWSVTAKLIVTYMFVAVVAVPIAVVAYYGMHRMMQNADAVVETRLPAIVAVKTAHEAQLGMSRAIRQLEVTDISNEMVRDSYRQFDEQKANAEKVLGEFGPLPKTAEEAKVWESLQPKWQAWLDSQNKSVELHKRYWQTKRDADYHAFLDFTLNDTLEKYNAVEADMTKLVGLNVAEGERLAKESHQTYGGVLLILLGTTILGLLVAVAIGIVITRSINKPLDRAIANLTIGAEQVASASSQIAEASQQLAEGSSEQASSLEETSSSLEEMASMTRQTAENAKQANLMAGEMRSSAEQGLSAMEEMSGAISRIKESADSTAKIVKTIDDIAFQTNLLALNAAVEAARAGEAGKGFAVVAEEVRNLALRSAEAAKTTASLIEESQGNAGNGVAVTQEVVVLLRGILEKVQKSTDLVAEVAAASQEQAQGIDQVNVAVAQMDRVTQSNSSNAEESASVAEELSAQARDLNDTLLVFTQVLRGANTTRADAVALGTSRRPAAHTAGATPDSHEVAKLVRELLQAEKAQVAKASAGGNGNGHKKFDPEEVIPLNEAELQQF